MLFRSSMGSVCVCARLCPTTIEPNKSRLPQESRVRQHTPLRYLQCVEQHYNTAPIHHDLPLATLYCAGLSNVCVCVCVCVRRMFFLPSLTVSCPCTFLGWGVLGGRGSFGLGRQQQLVGVIFLHRAPPLITAAVNVQGLGGGGQVLLHYV